MNIIFKNIDIENFRSIQKANVQLCDRGIVIVKGVNEYEDNATSNGSGKSSIFEAIVFALFEETSSGEKNVANRIINSGYSIKLDFSIDHNNYTILRQSAGTKGNVILYKNDVDISARNKTDTNKLIESILGISKNIFLDSIFLSQNLSTNLASLSPTARKERLEVLTNTDSIINSFKEQLKQKQLDYENKRVELQLKYNELNGNKLALDNQINNLNSRIYEIDMKIQQREQLGNLESIEQDINTNTESITNCQNTIQNIDEQISKLDCDINILREEQDKYNLDIQQVNNKIMDINKEISQYKSQINTDNYKISQSIQEVHKQQQEIDKVRNSDTCPTCGRKYENVNEDHIQSVIKEHEDIIQLEQINQQKYKNDIDFIQQNIDTYTKSLNELQNQVSNINTEVKNRAVQISNINTSKIDLNTKKQYQNSIINQCNQVINELQNRKQQILSFEVGNKQEFEDMKVNIENKIKDINENQNVIQTDIDTNNNYIEACKHSLQLVTKEFRTYLLQSSIQFLNNKLKEYSQKLFSNSSDIIYISSDDTKLNIQLGNATYESLSGGEKTRVDIALLLSQKCLASIVGNITCNLIVLDEILGYCDAQAECNVVDLITSELNTLESIFMISHKEIPIGYDDELTIVKNKQGLSTIKTY